MSKMRERIKTESGPLHKKLDKQYPYSKIVVNDEALDLVVYDFLLCFKMCFQNFLSKKKHENSFFEFSYDFFSSFEQDLVVNENQNLDSLELLAQEYLLLGSRMGNKMILKLNPALLTTKGAEYFNFKEDLGLMKDYQKKLEALNLDTTQSQKLVDKVKVHFNQMISLGSSLEEFKVIRKPLDQAH